MVDAAPAPATEPASEPAPEATPPPQPPTKPTPSAPLAKPGPIHKIAVDEPLAPMPEHDLTTLPTHDSFGPAPDAKVFHGQKSSLDFKDADIQNVLRVLADVSGLNIIATDDVQGKVTLHLTDVPWDQAFDLVLRTNRLEKTEDGSVVRVSSVNRLKEERDSLK